MHTSVFVPLYTCQRAHMCYNRCYTTRGCTCARVHTHNTHMTSHRRGVLHVHTCLLVCKNLPARARLWQACLSTRVFLRLLLYTRAHTWSVFSPAGACTHVCTSRYTEDGVTRGEDSVTCAVLHVHRGQPYMSDDYTHVACRRPHYMQNCYTCRVTGEPTKHYTCVTWKTVACAWLLHEEQCCVCG